MPLDTQHFGNPAALAFDCPVCHAFSGDMCVGRTDRPTYAHYLHKGRENLADMPQTRREWHRRANVIRKALGRAALPVCDKCV